MRARAWRWCAWLAAACLWLGAASAASAQSSLDLAGGPLSDGVVGVAYNDAVVATGGAGGYTYSLIGTLPPGLALGTDGSISGTPTVDGTFVFSVEVADVLGAMDSATYQIVVEPAPVIVPATLPDARVGRSYTQFFSVANTTTPYHFEVSEGSLPPGLALDLGGTLTGTPTAAGYYPFKITAVPAVDIDVDAHFLPSPTDTFPIGSITQDYMIDVEAAPITLSPSSLPDGRVGEAYAATVGASGGVPPYAYSISRGALPPGLSLDSGTGTIAGTPAAAGSFTFTIRASDPTEHTGSREYTVEILPPALTITPASLPDGQVGVAYAQALSAGGGTAPYAFALESGALPAGLSLHADGTIDGVPTAPGSSGFTVSATDALGNVGHANYTLAISAPAIVLSPAGLPDGQVGVAYAQALHASGGTAPYAFAVAGGSLPPGVALGSDGTLAGTPIAAGSHAFTVSATDAFGSSGTQAYTLLVAAAPAPTVTAHHATTPMNTPVQVALAEGAEGGPFTAADVVSVAPADAGTTAIAPAGEGFVLTFSPAAGFTGTATVHYTLSNASGPSSPGIVTIEVTALPDPLAEAEVAGLAQSQATIAQVFAQTQVTNIVDRLERLQEPRTQPWGFWVAGAFRRGDLDANGNAEGLTFETSGVTTGADRRFGERFSFGVAGGLGRDRTLVGGRGSRSDSQANAAVGYGSFHPVSMPFFVSAMRGHQRLRFQLRRFVAAGGAAATATGGGGGPSPLAAGIQPLADDAGTLLDSERTGGQDFSSLGGGYRHEGKTWTFTSYGRQDDVSTTLDPYTEPGGTADALHYDRQAMRTRTSIVGFRADGKREVRWGTLLPKLKIELQRDDSDQGEVAVRYANQPGSPVFRYRPRTPDGNRVALELGATLVTRRFLTLRLEYHAMLGGLYRNDNAIVFSFQKEH